MPRSEPSCTVSTSTRRSATGRSRTSTRRGWSTRCWCSPTSSWMTRATPRSASGSGPSSGCSTCAGGAPGLRPPFERAQGRLAHRAGREPRPVPQGQLVLAYRQLVQAGAGEGVPSLREAGPGRGRRDRVRRHAGRLGPARPGDPVPPRGQGRGAQLPLQPGEGRRPRHDERGRSRRPSPRRAPRGPHPTRRRGARASTSAGTRATSSARISPRAGTSSRRCARMRAARPGCSPTAGRPATSSCGTTAASSIAAAPTRPTRRARCAAPPSRGIRGQRMADVTGSGPGAERGTGAAPVERSTR